MIEEEHFELDPLWDRKPVEFLEDWGDVDADAGKHLRVWMVCSNNAVAIINSGHDEGVDQWYLTSEVSIKLEHCAEISRCDTIMMH